MSAFDAREHQWMERALGLARQAGERGEVPVGAVIADSSGVILAAAANAPITLSDASAHAEILALRQAGQRTGNYRLPGCVAVVTLEPCAMCAAAFVHARIERLVFGAFDPKSGACGSALDLLQHHSVNHRIDAQGGLLAAEAGQLLRDFFSARR